MTADKLRKTFLDFFSSKKHTVVDSDSLVPSKYDPTVLFTSAGMNQFKEQFMGQNVAFTSAATCQKCLRTPDLGRVGRTAGHHTFFEMLGNFSFGDYFKKEAIKWAWEFMVDVMKLPKEKLWVSVYKDDQEAYDIWIKDIKVPVKKVLRFGEKDNFWPAEAPSKGPDGPCGPCSEIFYDQGKDVGCRKPACNPSCECDRFTEVWNLVFTQFNRVGVNKLEPLANKNIDTGMGLERLAAVMQGVLSNFETDLFVPIIKGIEKIAGRKADGKTRPLFRAIADHARSVTFLIADGVLPSNEEKGYVERMLIRRAYRFGRQIGIDGPFLYKLVPIVAKVMKDPYPELESMREDIAQVVLNEEKRFKNTLITGTEVLEELIEKLKADGKKEISGKEAFKLYDTYGFPFELTRDSAGAKGLAVDVEGFNSALEKQRELSRASSGMKESIFIPAVERIAEGIKESTVFEGYERDSLNAEVIAIIKETSQVKELDGGDAEIILDKTPFYAEAGGQIGDAGVIAKRGFEFKVKDTRKVGNVCVHIGKVIKGGLKEGDKVKAEVDKKRRQAIAGNHTATHLLHWALRKVLGDHAKQAGSLVAPDRLRFDFTHFKKLTDDEVSRIETLVNDRIKADEKLSDRILEMEQAKTEGAIALFGEKYSNKVRMVSISDFSRELCGGIHVKNTGKIGLFKIVSESSVASGVRRIEAATGKMAVEKAKEAKTRACREEKEAKLKEDEKKVKKERDKKRILESRSQIEEIIKNAETINGTAVIVKRIDDASMGLMRSMTDEINKKAASNVTVLGSAADDKVVFIASVSKDLIDKGLHAGNLIKEAAKEAGGSGGGRPDFAQAGGKDPKRLNAALEKARELIKKDLKK